MGPIIPVLGSSLKFFTLLVSFFIFGFHQRSLVIWPWLWRSDLTSGLFSLFLCGLKSVSCNVPSCSGIPHRRVEGTGVMGKVSTSVRFAVSQQSL
jgi:hypothetical protein